MWSGVVRRSFAHLCFILNENCSQLCEMAANAPPLRLRCPWKCYVSSRYRPFRRISSVAGVDAPAFVERWSATRHGGTGTSVAGVDAPAFVERRTAKLTLDKFKKVSPGLMPRPSLSVVQRHLVHRSPLTGVAGVDAPAFVERTTPTNISTPLDQPGVAGVDAPAFVERPHLQFDTCRPRGVAGVDAPAFVERANPSWPTGRCAGVAGVDAPAFVERLRRRSSSIAPEVSVAGVDAPAFVERC